MRSKTVPLILHRVLKNPFLDHLHSGKNSWGNLAFSLVVTASMLPEWTSFPFTDIKVHSKIIIIIYKL